MRNHGTVTTTINDYLHLQLRAYWIEQSIAYRPKTTISLSSILEKDGDLFVETLYEKILGRPPDEQGRDHHMKLLKNGTPKQDLIRSLIQSDEAQARDIQLDQPIESLERHAHQNSFFLRIKQVIRQFIPGL
jgi:hypothetical protein